MNKYDGDQLVWIGGRLADLDTEVWLQKEVALTADDKKKLLNRLKDILLRSARLELPSTIDQLIRIKNDIDADVEIKYPHSWQMIRSLNERFMDDVGRCYLLVIPKKSAYLYEAEQLFGEKVFNNFPTAIVDIEEAGKCLALERGTAAVFHLMRVMEAGLKATATALGIPYAPSWESYLKQIGDKLDLPWRRKSHKWRKEEPFFREVQAHLHAVKIAWRNPTMHIVQHYTPERAEDVYDAVKGFMRHLATKLAEQSQRKRNESA